MVNSTGPAPTRASHAAWALGMALLALACPVRAALQDEIQVYLDDLNKPGEFGLQMHVNATPAGHHTPGWPGEVVSDQGVRATAEFAYGLGHGLEAGLYLPTAYGDGRYRVAGAKARMKWVWVDGETHGGVFSGVNLELGRVAQRYELSRSAAELRFIAGRETERWLLACNPIFDFELSDGYRSGTADVQLPIKVGRKVAPGILLGGEYYPDFGKTNAHPGFQQQDHRLYAVIDVDRKPWQVNVGVGYGLSDAADKWTIKTIFTVPF